jgi:hypothetical protein
MVSLGTSHFQAFGDYFFHQTGLLKFSKIPDMVWQDFSVSSLRLRYMGNDIFKLIKAPLTYIGDQVDSGSTLENVFPEAAKMFLIYYKKHSRRMAGDDSCGSYN